MVRVIYVEKKPEFAIKAEELRREIREVLLIPGVERVRILNRYFVEDLSDQAFQEAKETIFSEPPVDITYDELDPGEGKVIAVEYLPGQFDQRASSAEECVKFIAPDEDPAVKSATVYILEGDISDQDLERIRAHLINPVEAREASLEVPETLRTSYPEPEKVAVSRGSSAMTTMLWRSSGSITASLWITLIWPCAATTSQVSTETLPSRRSR